MTCRVWEAMRARASRLGTPGRKNLPGIDGLADHRGHPHVGAGHAPAQEAGVPGGQGDRHHGHAE